MRVVDGIAYIDKPMEQLAKIRLLAVQSRIIRKMKRLNLRRQRITLDKLHCVIRDAVLRGPFAEDSRYSRVGKLRSNSVFLLKANYL